MRPRGRPDFPEEIVYEALSPQPGDVLVFRDGLKYLGETGQSGKFVRWNGSFAHRVVNQYVSPLPVEFRGFHFTSSVRATAILIGWEENVVCCWMVTLV